MFSYILNLLFPTKCIVCDGYHSQAEICSDCWSNFTFITKPCCYICSFPFNYDDDSEAICGGCISTKPIYNRAISILRYDSYSKDLIHKFKYQDQLHVLNYLVNLMSNMGKELLEEADIIVPVAMHRNKLLKRGYNQSALLAMTIAAKNKIQYFPQAIIRNNNSIAQVNLTKDQRLKNVKGDFSLNPKFSDLIRGKKILLIDDVITTGATISECCKALQKAGPSVILVLTLAKKI
jgi:ComF family protein